MLHHTPTCLHRTSLLQFPPNLITSLQFQFDFAGVLYKPLVTTCWHYYLALQFVVLGAVLFAPCGISRGLTYHVPRLSPSLTLLLTAYIQSFEWVLS